MGVALELCWEPGARPVPPSWRVVPAPWEVHVPNGLGDGAFSKRQAKFENVCTIFCMKGVWRTI